MNKEENEVRKGQLVKLNLHQIKKEKIGNEIKPYIFDFKFIF